MKTFDKASVIKRLSREIRVNENALGRVVNKAQGNPTCFEARTKEVLVKKFYRDIKTLKARRKKLLSN